MMQRILIVGYGSIGKRHLSIARDSFPSAEIKILSRKKTDYFPINSNGCLFTLDQVKEFKPEIAIIANPANFHIETALFLASLNCNLLIEKPLSNALSGIDELLHEVESRNLILQVGYNLVFLPSLQYFKDIIHSDRIGKIYSVRAEVGQYLPTWRPDADYRDTVSARSDLGGGALLELSHELDYLRWIFGDVDWVHAFIAKQSDLDIDVEDMVHLVIGFKNFITSKPLIASVDLDFIRQDRTRNCIVIGEKGSLRWDGIKGIVEVFLSSKNTWEVLYEREHQPNISYIEQFKHFIKCIETGSNPLKTGRDGLAVLKIIEAARISNENSSSKIQI
ncbi:Gfo/Idh/MocA family oxidoreductase [Leptospira levettii]|uniref:Gfo/Idh/MocA family protein n=1 Tax=Leptospira levettii TaxID=2023178 RepID=UPI00223D9283|nr:Gfo/Idh/MocA family oxidoreductase [Leptospira levettii]MCW7497021.1 Gfo/Idh/MocA family oxidoreductase [Leptospira levettii]